MVYGRTGGRRGGGPEAGGRLTAGGGAFETGIRETAACAHVRRCSHAILLRDRDVIAMNI